MPLYALATIPLIQQLPSGVEQIWYDDDACACGKLGALCEWWDRLCGLSPSFGYFVNVAKTWLVTKDHLFQDSMSSFSGSGIRVTSNGHPYLGAAIGSESYIQSFIADKVKGRSEEITVLARFVESQPHADYCAFTHGLSSH